MCQVPGEQGDCRRERRLPAPPGAPSPQPGPPPGHHGVLNPPRAPQGTPGSICGRQGLFQLWGAELWHLVARGQAHSSTSTRPSTVPTSKQHLGPEYRGPERTHSEAMHQRGSARVTKKAWPGWLCRRPRVTRTHLGDSRDALPQSVHLGGFRAAGLWENRFLLHFVRSSLSPWDYFCFILQVWRRTADREDRRAQTPSSPRWGSSGPRFPSPHQRSGKAPGAEPEPQGLGEPSRAPWWALDPRPATTEPSKSALGDRPSQARKRALRG